MIRTSHDGTYIFFHCVGQPGSVRIGSIDAFSSYIPHGIARPHFPQTAIARAPAAQ
ncbi:MAG: hypothetical protein ABW184_12000 [Sphingobium sp.]